MYQGVKNIKTPLAFDTGIKGRILWSRFIIEGGS
jgi:hypothetical protein